MLSYRLKHRFGAPGKKASVLQQIISYPYGQNGKREIHVYIESYQFFNGGCGAGDDQQYSGNIFE
jgi:hypothetical protein